MIFVAASRRHWTGGEMPTSPILFSRPVTAIFRMRTFSRCFRTRLPQTSTSPALPRKAQRDGRGRSAATAVQAYHPASSNEFASRTTNWRFRDASWTRVRAADRRQQGDVPALREPCSGDRIAVWRQRVGRPVPMPALQVILSLGEVAGRGQWLRRQTLQEQHKLP